MLGRLYEDQVCSIARTLEVVGDRWTLLIMRDALLGLRRFDEFQESLGVARNVLADRMNRLVEEGILERVRYQPHPPRYEYVPTQKGSELFGVLLSLMQWGDRHVPNPGGPPRVVRHAECGSAVVQGPICETCGPVGPAAVSIGPGPGLPASA